MNISIRQIRDSLKELAEAFIKSAIALRMEDPKVSYKHYLRSEICRKAAEEMERLEPVEYEIEGSPGSWFYVCGECHGHIDQKDKYCRHCGRPIKWE